MAGITDKVKAAVKEAANTTKVVAKEEAQAELWRILHQWLFGTTVWLDEAIRALYDRQFRENVNYKANYGFFLEMLSPKNLKRVDQKCLDFIALTSAKISIKPLNEMEQAEIDQASFNEFCHMLNEVIKESIADRKFDVKKAHLRLKEMRWIGKGFWAERIGENALEIMKLEWVSEGAKRLVQTQAWEEFDKLSKDFLAWAQKINSESAGKRGRKTTNVKTDKRSGT